MPVFYRRRLSRQPPTCLTVPPRRAIASGVKYEPVLNVVLYEPEIPYNTGSVGRTCVAAGAKLWLVRPLGFRVDDYHLRRAGLDYREFGLARSYVLGEPLSLLGVIAMTSHLLLKRRRTTGRLSQSRLRGAHYRPRSQKTARSYTQHRSD